MGRLRRANWISPVHLSTMLDDRALRGHPGARYPPIKISAFSRDLYAKKLVICCGGALTPARIIFILVIIIV